MASSTTSVARAVGAHGWGNITVYGWNNTGQLLSIGISTNTQVPNNLISVINFSPIYVLHEGETFALDLGWYDLDPADGATYSDNATQWSLDTNGDATWNTIIGDAGTYDWQVCADDGWGA